MTCTAFQMSKHGCPLCSKSISKKYLVKPHKKDEKEFFKDFLKNEDMHGYTIVSDFLGMRKEIKVKHDKCGNVIKSKPCYLINKKRKNPLCKNKECQPKKAFKYNNDTFMEFASTKKSTEGYKLLDEFKGTQRKHKFLHEDCGHIFEMKANNFSVNKQ